MSDLTTAARNPAGTSPPRWDLATRAAFAFGLMLTGLVGGTFLATQLGQVPVQNALDARDFTLVKHEFEMALGQVMPVLMILTVVAQLALVGLLLRHRHSLRFGLVAVCTLAWVAAVVVTLIFNVPVNALSATWDAAAPPPNWAQLRDQWHTGQGIRTALTVPAFALLVLAAVLPEVETRKVS